MEAAPTSEQCDSYSDLRVAYEQRLSAALAEEQYPVAREMLSALERLGAVQRGRPVTWGASDWERELQAKLAATPPTDETGAERPLLSASSVETYAQCPLKYRLGYIDNVPESASKPQLTFGSIIHRVLEQFHRDRGTSEAELLELLERFWQPEAFDYESRERSFKEQGVELLQRYFRYITANPPQVVETELAFKFDLDTCALLGKIDRIDRTEAGYKVVDYKTGKTPTAPKDSLQLAVYCLYLAQRDDSNVRGLPAGASLIFLREEDQPERTHRFTAAELEAFRAQIATTVTGIQNRDFPARTGHHCSWCDYKQLLCPAWEDER